MMTIEQIKSKLQGIQQMAHDTNESIKQSLTDVPDSEFRTPAGNLAHRQKVQVAKIKPFIKSFASLKAERDNLVNEAREGYKKALSASNPKSDVDRALFQRELALLKLDIGRLPAKTLQQRLSALTESIAGDVELLDQLAPFVSDVTLKLAKSGNIAESNIVTKAFREAFNTNPELVDWHTAVNVLEGLSDSVLYNAATARKVAQELGINVNAAKSMLEHADMAESFESHITKNGEDYAVWRTHQGHKEVAGTAADKKAAEVVHKAHQAHYLTFERGTMQYNDYKASQDKLAAKNTNDEVSE